MLRPLAQRGTDPGSADALAIPGSSQTWVRSGHVCPSQGPEQYWPEGQARPWRNRHFESETPGTAPESVPRADPSSHTDRDADTILCGYPAGVKTWRMPGGQLRSVLASANPSMWLPQLLHCLCGQEILGLLKPQQPTLSPPSRTATSSVCHTKNQGRQDRQQMCERQTNSK